MPSAWTLSRIEAVIFIATVLLTASAGTWLSVGADRVLPAGRYPDSRSSTRAIVGPMSAARASARCCRTAAERARVATEMEFNGIGGLPIYIRIVPVRGTFRTGERTFQCKRLLPLPPLGAQSLRL